MCLSKKSWQDIRDLYRKRSNLNEAERMVLGLARSVCAYRSSNTLYPDRDTYLGTWLCLFRMVEEEHPQALTFGPILQRAAEEGREMYRDFDSQVQNWVLRYERRQQEFMRF